MDPIRKLLQRYQTLTPPNESVRKAVCAAIQEVCDVVIAPKNISYRSGQVVVTTSPSIRSTILEHKQDILERLKSSIKLQIKDIR